MNVNLRKCFFWLIFFTILFTISFAGLNYRNEEKKTPALQNAFSSTGAKFVNNEVYVWCKIDKQSEDQKSLLELADKLSDSVGMLKNSDFSKNTVNSDLICKTEIKGVTSDGKTVCITTQLNKNKSGTDKSFISIDLINELTQLDINGTANLLKENLKVLA